MNDNFYRLFFRSIIGALAIYGAINLSTQLRLAEHIRATVPRITAEGESESVIDTPVRRLR